MSGGAAAAAWLLGAAYGDPSASLERVVADGQIFRQAGKPWRWRGVSAFKLLELHRRGQPISTFCAAFPGYNVLRVFSYTPAKEWGAEAWEPPTVEEARAFVAAAAAEGFFVELVLLTDDDPARVPHAKALAEGLADLMVFVEAANEPRVHKSIDTAALRDTLQASGILHASGDGDDPVGAWYGGYGTHHSPRDDEWTRKAKDAREFFTGQGPTQPHPPYKAPWVLDEPKRPDQAGYAQVDFYTYAANGAINGAGATFHYEGGKFGRAPTLAEWLCSRAFLEGLMIFPADAPLGAYRRIEEFKDPTLPDGDGPGQLRHPSNFWTLRTYVVGPYMVRVKPQRLEAYEPGWAAMDDRGICWLRAA